MNIGKLASSVAIAGVLLISSAGMAFAQTDPMVASTTAGVTTSAVDPATTVTAVPGAPNTGAGGTTVTNILVLSISAILAIGGVVYLAPQRKLQK